LVVNREKQEKRSSKRILIVDDEPDIAFTNVMFVAIFGFPETDKANNYLLLAQDARARTGTSPRGISVEVILMISY
jgi:hypothetical protein